VIAGGRIVYEGELEELLRGAGRRFRLSAAEPLRAVRVLSDVAGVSSVALVEDQVTFAADPDDATLLALTTALTDAGVAIRALVPEQLTLEHVFFELTERGGRVEPMPV
jgi:ABC-type multidrug transport system ATPase subunit